MERLNACVADINERPIKRLVGGEIMTGGGKLCELDIFVVATQFDTATGALEDIDIRAI